MNQEFMRLFRESQSLTEAGRLKSSLEKLQAATLTADDRGWRALGKANEAILLGNHLGDGLAAYKAARESLSYIKDFQSASAEFAEMTQLTVFEDILNILPRWSENYEECLRLNQIRVVFLPSQESNDKLQEIMDLKSQETEWWLTRLGLAYNFYGSERPEPDLSRIAQGMSVLQCLLRRALDETPGFNLTAEQFEAVLLDYIFIGYKYLEVLRKRLRSKGGDGKSRDKEEILAVAGNILDIWLEVAPDIPTWKKENRKEFEDVFGYYWLFLDSFNSLDNFEAKHEMLPLTKYFKKAMRTCIKCRKPIPKVATFCRNCLWKSIQKVDLQHKKLFQEFPQKFPQETRSSSSDSISQEMFDPFSGWEDQSSDFFPPFKPKSLATRIFNWLVLLGCTAIFIYWCRTDYYENLFPESGEISLRTIGRMLVGVFVPFLGISLWIEEMIKLLLYIHPRRFK
ncbi:MAG: hypothetical protein LBS44_07020 [Deltaproteobacteria bacterium]|jgi:hypothetical protein|nr:hypothetical protein [Deltaproteobacteria bacterium]